MAILKIIGVKGSYRNKQATDNLIDYLAKGKGDKIQDFNGGISLEDTKAQFKNIEKLMNVTDTEKKDFHMVISLEGNAVSTLKEIQIFNQIAQETMTKTFGEGVVFATAQHKNTENSHLHICMSTQDIENNRNFYMTKEDVMNLNLNYIAAVNKYVEGNKDKYMLTDRQLENLDIKQRIKRDELKKDSPEYKEILDKRRKENESRKVLTNQALMKQAFRPDGTIKKGGRYEILSKYNDYLEELKKNDKTKLSDFNLEINKSGNLKNIDKKSTYRIKDLIVLAELINKFDSVKELDKNNRMLHIREDEVKEQLKAEKVDFKALQGLKVLKHQNNRTEYAESKIWCPGSVKSMKLELNKTKQERKNHVKSFYNIAQRIQIRGLRFNDYKNFKDTKTTEYNEKITTLNENIEKSMKIIYNLIREQKLNAVNYIRNKYKKLKQEVNIHNNFQKEKEKNHIDKIETHRNERMLKPELQKEKEKVSNKESTKKAAKPIKL